MNKETKAIIGLLDRALKKRWAEDVWGWVGSAELPVFERRKAGRLVAVHVLGVDPETKTMYYDVRMMI